MNFLEKDLENIIWESDNEKLQNKNLPIEGKKYRQLRIGNYGILDLMTISKDYIWCDIKYKTVPCIDITVYELKKEKVGISAFLQAVKYCKGIQSYIKTKGYEGHYKIHIVLSAKEVDLNSDFIYLTDLFNHKYSDSLRKINSVSFYSFSYDIDGIIFKKHENYDLIQNGF